MTVEAVNLGRREALLSDGRVVPVVAMFDADGEETEEPGAAVSLVVRGGPSRWFAVRVGAFEPVARH